jgi:hypothetical protein
VSTAPRSYWQATSNVAFECWFAYSPYGPVMVGKLLDIFLVFYNFVEVGRNRQTKWRKPHVKFFALFIDNCDVNSNSWGPFFWLSWHSAALTRR